MNKQEELLQQLVDIEKLLYLIDINNFVGTMLNIGRGYSDAASLILQIPPGYTVSLDIDNPVGYVWIPMRHDVRVDTTAVMSMQLNKDNKVFISLPAVYDFTLDWAQSPYVGITAVVEKITSLSITNNDAAAHWIIMSYTGLYIEIEKYNEYRNSVTDIVRQVGWEER